MVAALIRTTILSNRLLSSYVSSLFNVHCKAAGADCPAAAAEEAVDQAAVPVVDDQVAVADFPEAGAVVRVAVVDDDKSEIHSTDQRSTCGNCRVRTTF